ncbi:zinc finger protein 462-like isoform X2 [Echeneis naucrates]|uniref:Zinc finger protein 462-like n=1 Tax=Echeneis naucrates TaxID=173247 RepID=A0A665WE10_ECHNA|nr:zinc finger protein 462-like isoform X2 [Echeneis naucrates]
MQKDSMHFPTSGHMTHKQSVIGESPIKSFRCTHCTLICKSKVCLFEHLNKVHYFDVSNALIYAGLKQNEVYKTNTDSSSSGNNFLCHHCDFKACSQDILNEHRQQCDNKSENQIRIGNPTISEISDTQIVIFAKQPNTEETTKESLSVKSTSETKCMPDLSKNLKTYERPLQTITKLSAEASVSQEKLSVDSAENPVLDSTKGTLILQESASSYSPNRSGVLKVTAKSMIDISNPPANRFLLNDDALDLDPAQVKPAEQFKEPPIKVVKRTSNESIESCPAKKTKSPQKESDSSEKEEANKQQPSRNGNFSFDISEDEEEKPDDTESPNLYFCKRCDYNDADIRRLLTHYQNDHPYVRCNMAYIQDPSNRTVTFRCLECPVEFFSVTDLKRHYTEMHPEAPNVFTKQPHELSLVFKCFVCPFTTSDLEPLKEHYKEKHPNHIVDNPLFYSRYSAPRSEEGSRTKMNSCVKVHSPERSKGHPIKNKEIENSFSSLHPISTKAAVALYKCNKCKFSHKSIVVMQVHYQKSHSAEAITIDQIKRLVNAPPQVTSQMPEKSLTETKTSTVTVTKTSTSQENISNSSQKSKDKPELSQKKILFYLKPMPDASETHEEAPKPEEAKTSDTRSKTKTLPTKCPSSSIKMFYCKFCSYSSKNIRSVCNHQNMKHAEQGKTGNKEILLYSAKMQKKLQRKAEASGRTSNSKTRKQVEVHNKKRNDHVKDASMVKSSPFSCAENLFYCQKCNYGNPTAMGVHRHQIVVHQCLDPSCLSILEYTASIREEIKKSKSNSKKLASATGLPLPLMNEGDENMFFCYLCNYRHRGVSRVLNHGSRRHNGFMVKTRQILEYTSLVLKEVSKMHPKTPNQEVKHTSLRINGKKTKKLLSKDSPGSASSSVKQTQRNLKCHRCSFTTQYVYLLRRHMWTGHRTSPSTNQVLRRCFHWGMLEPGYHCDLCVFSHNTAAVLYKHYQTQHPERKLTLDYVSTRLHVGAKTRKPKKKTSKVKQADCVDEGDGIDGSSPSQRVGQSKNKSYSCRACSFRGHSLSSIEDHYRAVHPWTVKEDGSVLNVITSKESSANTHVDEMPESFDIYQVPLEFEKSLDSSCEGAESPTGISEILNEEQVKIQALGKIYKCPYCAYVNTNHKGFVTHFYMMHPTSVFREDRVDLDEAHLSGLRRKDPSGSLTFRGYMCQTCPQIHTTLQKLNKHRENDHAETGPNTDPDMLKGTPKPSARGKIQKSNTHSTRGSILTPSFLHKNIYTVVRCQYCRYKCKSKLALFQHVRVHHQNISVPREKCVLCSKSYLRGSWLKSHYLKEHGKAAYLKYGRAISKKVPENSSLDSPLNQQPKTACEVLASSTTSEEGKILVYRCPRCAYVNASLHGMLTHCQMRHPTLVARAERLKTGEILVKNMVGCTMGKGSNERGYMCKKCPQIHKSLLKLTIHHQKDHSSASTQSTDTEPQEDCNPSVCDSEFEAASLQNKTSAVSDTDTDFQQLGCPEKSQVSQKKELLYKCHMCAYRGVCRKYLHCHYRNTHRLDKFSTHKLLQKYSKRKRKVPNNMAKTASEERTQYKCKTCPSLTFDSSHLLIDHYSTFHCSDWKLDFTMLSEQTKSNAGVFQCAHCNKHIYGVRNLRRHLDRHSASERKMATASKALFVTPTPPDTTSSELYRQEEVPIFNSVDELTQWNVTPVETFALPASPQSSHSYPTDSEQPDLNSGVDEHTCKQCARTFRSLKGLLSHKRSHEALAAIKKQNNLPASLLKHDIRKFVVHKSGTTKPFLCSCCSYRTTVLGLWISHFMKKHHDVIEDLSETDKQDEENSERASKETPNSSQVHLVEPDEEPDKAEESRYLEPPDVQRQLNHYGLMAQTVASQNTNQQEAEVPDTSLLHCEFCNFSTGHLSSIRRHYLNRHGKKILRCKDCDFFTSLRKTLEMHIEMGHSAFQSKPTHHKDIRCPFCLYQTKNKNNMIDHIVLHREERVVPIEVRRPKLSRYLQGIVFRCHKCTFTSGSAENLRLHTMRHDDIKPYKCRLCYFNCTQLSNLEAHLTDKHQVLRNLELVGEVSLEQLEARVGRMPEEEEQPLNPEDHISEHEDAETEETQAENPTENMTTVQMMEVYPKDKPQDPADTVRGEQRQDVMELKGKRGNNADNQFEECDGQQWTTNENQTHPKEEEDDLLTWKQDKDWEHGKGEGRNNTAPLVHKSAFIITDEAAEVLPPSAMEKKPFTCELCGRSFMNSSELKSHIMRHGM